MPPESRPFLDLRLLASALEATAESVQVDDIEGRVLFVNDAWCQLFERDRRGVTGVRRDALNLGTEEVHKLKTSWSRCLSMGQSQGTFRLGRSDGTATTVWYAHLLYRNAEGAATAAITVYRPLDSSAVLSLQLRQLEHGLRNVLTVIIINLELVERGTDDQGMRSRFALMRGAVVSGLELIEGMQYNPVR